MFESVSVAGRPSWMGGRDDSDGADLMRRIWEVGPLVCPKFGGAMNSIAFVTNVVFVGFSMAYLGESLRWNSVVAFAFVAAEDRRRAVLL